MQGRTDGEPGGERAGEPVRRILWGAVLVSIVAWPSTLLGWWYISLAAEPSWLRDSFLLGYLVTLLAIDSTICVVAWPRFTRSVRAVLRSEGTPDAATVHEAWREALRLPMRTSWLVVGLIALTVAPITIFSLFQGDPMFTVHGWTAALLVGACEVTLLFPIVQATTLPFLRQLKRQHPELRLREPGTPTPPVRAYFAFALVATATVATVLVGRLVYLRTHPDPTPENMFPEGAAIVLTAVCLSTMVGGIALELYSSVLVPMRRLAEAINRYARGDRSVRVGFVHAGEVGLLAEHFDDMVVTLVNSRAEVEAREAQLRHAQRFEVMGTMAATFVHEISNPLTGVRVNLSLADDALRGEARVVPGGEPIPPVPVLLSDARAALDQMTAVLRDMRVLGRKESAEEQASCDLAAVLDGALRLGGADLRRCGTVVREYAPGARVQASAHKLSQVFLNLVLNAAQALPPGSEGLVRVGLRPVNGGVEAWVADNGPGIPPAVQVRLFEPLFTTKGEGKGTGLGLHVSRRIVEELGGRLTYEPTPGGGATFRVFLPGSAS